MIILTAANAETAKDDSGKTYPHFSFKSVIQKTIDKAGEHGYTTIVYDLGSLGMGRPFYVEDCSFLERGYYEKEVIKGYKSKSLFKPKMVRKCMEEFQECIVYLDGDAQLCDNIDEMAGSDYDIGVTLRDPYEFESEWYKEHIELVRYVNAGVIIFNPTLATKKFINSWVVLTEDLGNDQMALNQMTCPAAYPSENSIIEIDGVRIKYFSGKRYNYYYFEQGLVPGIKIIHFKGSVRHFYPFDWKKKFYCKNIVPIKKSLRSFAKKLLLR